MHGSTPHAPAPAQGASALCTVCASPASLDPFFYRWKGREWWIARCTACTHQFVHPGIGEEEQAEIFADGYFSEAGDWSCGWWGKAYEDATAELREEARRVIELLGDRAPPGRLLDIGCAGGEFLGEARAHGWEVAGVELNPTMAARAGALDIPVYLGAADTAPLDVFTEPFDAIVTMDTLEHVPAPAELMRRVRAWTRPGSVLLIRGPIVLDRMARLKEAARRVVRRRKQLPGYPLDANFFNERSMTRLLERFGFRILDWPTRQPALNFAQLRAVRTDD